MSDPSWLGSRPRGGADNRSGKGAWERSSQQPGQGLGAGSDGRSVGCRSNGVHQFSGLKALEKADGPPHNLGQFYILIDTSAHGGALKERFARCRGHSIGSGSQDTWHSTPDLRPG